MQHRRINDWAVEELEAISRDYTAGILTTVEICQRYKTSWATVQRLAKIHGWTKPDLDKIVKLRVRESGLRELARSQGFKNPTERQAIEAGVVEGLRVNRQHKSLCASIAADLDTVRAAIMADESLKPDKKASALRDIVLPALKTVQQERGIYDLNENAVAPIAVNLGLGCAALADLDLIPKRPGTGDAGGEK